MLDSKHEHLLRLYPHKHQLPVKYLRQKYGVTLNRALAIIRDYLMVQRWVVITKKWNSETGCFTLDDNDIIGQKALYCQYSRSEQTDVYWYCPHLVQLENGRRV